MALRHHPPPCCQSAACARLVADPPPPCPVALLRPQALGVNDDSLFFVLLIVPLVLGFAFNQWQDYQDDDEEDFFDTYESRRVDRVSSNRNRV